MLKEHYTGHVWCRVIINGVEKDVCPGSIENKPGIVQFKPVLKVRNWNLWVNFWSYWGSAVVNYKRLNDVKRLKEKKTHS